MTDVVIEKKGHVAIVKIEHMKAMNALSTDMYAQLEEAFDELAKDLDNVYAVVLTGSSTVNKKGKTVNSFVAGADISEMATKTCAEGQAVRQRVQPRLLEDRELQASGYRCHQRLLPRRRLRAGYVLRHPSRFRERFLRSA